MRVNISGFDEVNGHKGKMVMETKVVISFTRIEAIQVERIALDRNRDEALEMIERVILKKVREASRPH